MARYFHPDVLDNGPAYLRANCDSMVLVSTYTFGDNYATVTGNVLAAVSMAPTDFTLADGASNSRTMTTASGKQDTAADDGGGGASMHIAFLDTVNSKVLGVTEETSDQTITAGNPVLFPEITVAVGQPVVL